ncbi:MAG: sensor histidine kinase, partial [Stackebrandtia sp.]
LNTLVESVDRAGIEVAVAVDGVPDDVPAAVSLTAYRIVQEALSNVVRHAPGAATEVTVTGSAQALSITVDNDGPVSARRTAADSGPPAGADSTPADLGSGGGDPGIGAVASGGEWPGGSGLAGMRERAWLLGGELTAEPNPRGGFTVHAVLPYGTDGTTKEAP